MPGNVFRALLSGVLLIILAWVGMGILHKLHGSGALLPAMCAWGLVFVGLLIFAIYSATRSRRPPM
jgi:hypothetical protein